MSEEGTSVNVVRTRFVDTTSLADTFGPEFPAFVRQFEPDVLSTPEEVADAIVGVCSGLMDALGGQVLTVDRGAGLYENFSRLYQERDTPSHRHKETTMTREEVHAVVAKHLAVSSMASTPPPSIRMRSMKDYGANSLDIVEVVSGAMRELKVKVPRTELNKLTNVDGLVGLLYDIKTRPQRHAAAMNRLRRPRRAHHRRDAGPRSRDGAGVCRAWRPDGADLRLGQR